MDNAEYSTIPEYNTVKGTYLNLYFVALSCMGDYMMKPYHTTVQNQAKESIYNLTLALFPKCYILNDAEAVNYMAYFMRNPHKFEFRDIHTMWLILQRIIERLGITKIESLQIPKYKSFTENANY